MAHPKFRPRDRYPEWPGLAYDPTRSAWLDDPTLTVVWIASAEPEAVAEAKKKPQTIEQDTLFNRKGEQ